MNEVKRPKKPLIYYYSIVVLILLLFNFLAMPWIAQRQVREAAFYMERYSDGVIPQDFRKI